MGFEVGIGEQRGRDQTGEFGRFEIGQHRLHLRRERRARDRLQHVGQDVARPQRHYRHGRLGEVDRHVVDHLVGARLGGAIGRAMKIADRAVEGDGDDQRPARGDHQRRGVIGRDIVRAQADIDHVDEPEILLPEGPRPRQFLSVDRGGVVDEQVEPSGLPRDAREQVGELAIIAMVAGHRDPRAARLRDFRRSIAQRIAVAAGEIDGHALAAQRAGDAAAQAPAGAGDDRDRVSHVGTSSFRFGHRA